MTTLDCQILFPTKSQLWNFNRYFNYNVLWEEKNAHFISNSLYVAKKIDLLRYKNISAWNLTLGTKRAFHRRFIKSNQLFFLILSKYRHLYNCYCTKCASNFLIIVLLRKKTGLLPCVQVESKMFSLLRDRETYLHVDYFWQRCAPSEPLSIATANKHRGFHDLRDLIFYLYLYLHTLRRRGKHNLNHSQVYKFAMLQNCSKQSLLE